jgi:uncharacterized protein YndB with AHSA1/START domain
VADQQLAQFVQIQAPIESVWSALTDPGRILQWLAEACDVDLDAGRYHLRSGTPGVTGHHRVEGVEVGRSLQLAWQLDAGTTTPLRVELEAVEGGTRMVTHHHRQAAASMVSAGHLHELWAYNNSLLKTWLELGKAVCRMAPGRAPEPAIRHSMDLAVPAAEVFAALTEPERIKAWNAFAPAPLCEGRVGGRYAFGWEGESKQTDGPGEIVAYEPDRVLSHRWHGDPPTLVRWELSPLPGTQPATRLTLVHSGFGVDQNMLVDFNLGWADFMAHIAIYLERGVGAGWSGVAG